MHINDWVALVSVTMVVVGVASLTSIFRRRQAKDIEEKQVRVLTGYVQALDMWLGGCKTFSLARKLCMLASDFEQCSYVWDQVASQEYPNLSELETDLFEKWDRLAFDWVQWENDREEIFKFWSDLRLESPARRLAAEKLLRTCGKLEDYLETADYCSEYPDLEEQALLEAKARKV